MREKDSLRQWWSQGPESCASFVRRLQPWDVYGMGIDFSLKSAEEIVRIWDRCARGVDSAEANAYRDTTDLFTRTARFHTFVFVNSDRFRDFGNPAGLSGTNEDLREGVVTRPNRRNARKWLTRHKHDENLDSELGWEELVRGDEEISEESLRAFWMVAPSARVSNHECARTLWPGRAMLVLRAGNDDERKAWMRKQKLDDKDQDDVDKKIMRNRRWWRDSRNKACWWSFEDTNAVHPGRTASATLNHVAVFHIAGFFREHVIGHWLESDTDIRKGCRNFSLRHAFGPRFEHSKGSGGWWDVLPTGITARGIQRYGWSRVPFDLWATFHILSGPFDLCPVLRQRTRDGVPSVGIPRPVLTDVRTRFGRDFVEQALNS